jgi:predicted DNA-binding transcriptional regulator AlpA
MGGKRRTALDQLELFSANLKVPAPPPALAHPLDQPIEPIEAEVGRSTEKRPQPQPRASYSSNEPFAKDEWWTTRMVCAFLKISRKTLWERRRNAALDFPRPVNLGGSRNVYRASAVRAWAETMAIAELCELG